MNILKNKLSGKLKEIYNYYRKKKPHAVFPIKEYLIKITKNGYVPLSNNMRQIHINNFYKDNLFIDKSNDFELFLLYKEKEYRVLIYDNEHDKLLSQSISNKEYLEYQDYILLNFITEKINVHN